MSLESISPITASKPIKIDSNMVCNNTAALIRKDKNSEEVNTAKLDSLSSIGKKDLDDAINEVNKAIADYNRRFEFSVHEKTGSIMVKVINTETNEVIREIPPEKLLDMVAKLWELAGIIVDKRV